MDKTTKAKMIDVTAGNIEQTGFFCYMSKRKSEGFRRKLAWLKARFAEGLRIKMFELPERGFIEYIPGEYAWRSVNAKGYLVIHCLWVVGRSKGRGLGGVLLNACLRDAQESGSKGVAMVTSERNWLSGKGLLLKHGFEIVAEALPFEFLVKKFGQVPAPTFANDWEGKAARFGRGLTVIRSDQCPYLPDATDLVLEFAKKRGLPSRVVELKSSRDVREFSPSPYGTFSIVYDGRLLADHYLLPKDLERLLPNTG